MLRVPVAEVGDGLKKLQDDIHKQSQKQRQEQREQERQVEEELERSLRQLQE